MGFYLDLKQSEKKPDFYLEASPPVSFWLLYGLGCLALIGMMLAAHSIMGDLLKQATLWDWGLVSLGSLALLIFLGAGIKLFALRKFIRRSGSWLEVGYYFLGQPICTWKINSKDIHEISVVNQRPAPNLAPQFHDDPQYYIRGHWRLVVSTAKGKTKVLDKHVEREALLPLLSWLSQWQAK